MVGSVGALRHKRDGVVCACARGMGSWCVLPGVQPVPDRALANRRAVGTPLMGMFRSRTGGDRAKMTYGVVSENKRAYVLLKQTPLDV